MSSNDSQVAKIQTHFQTLSEVAFTLNSASDELTKAVGILDEALKKLNIGLMVWVDYASHDGEPWEYDDEQIGYCKVNGKWGLSLQRLWGDNQSDNHGSEGPWLFNDAPREMRLKSVDKIPDVIERLGKEASDTAKRVEEKTKQVRELAAAITEPEGERNGTALTAVGITQSQVKAIRTSLQAQQKFLSELLGRSHRWELSNGVLKIHFTNEMRAFAEMVEGRDSIARIAAVAKQILNQEIKVISKVVEAALPNVSSPSDIKGRK
jgi:hypothetical protein